MLTFADMRRFCILFLSFHLLSGTVLSREVYRLPFLFSHYYDYFQKQTLAEYLQEHYAGDHKDDGDARKDHQLPFKSTVQAFSTVNALSPNVTFFSFITTPATIKTVVSNSMALLHGYKGRLLQPPCN